MKKIVLVSPEPKKDIPMVALIEAVFPECTVEVVPGPIGEGKGIGGAPEEIKFGEAH
jgi:hypothetical protein